MARISAMKKLGRHTNLVHPEGPPPIDGRLVFEKSFSATSAARAAVLDELVGMLEAHGAVKDADVRTRLCLDEALANAVLHGSHGDASKSIRVELYIGSEAWRVLIEDEGRGFLEEDLPDPRAPENQHEDSGRGVILIRSMMDEASYWNGGRTLLMGRSIT